ncbi:MAG: UDP-N-acetylglucosamine 1-carboxyvinyltransferase [Thermoanaerobaculia bacterium]
MKERVYRIDGGRPVRGEITCLGAKNFITKAMVASVLGDGPTTLTNVPRIGDTQITADMLQAIGAEIAYDRSAGTMRIDPRPIQRSVVPLPDSGSNRVPILLLGALLHRFEEVAVPALGGCRIGRRPVDFHLGAIQQFGGKVEESDDGFLARRAGRLRATRVVLPYPSVGATETSLYLSVLAEGRSIISNAAIEPEILELVTMLRGMGAVIYTSPGREILVDGVKRLRGTTMSILGDRIEAASWACLACASAGEITVHGIRPEILGNFLSYFRQVGGGFEFVGAESIRFHRQSALSPAVIETDVYPGFSTDWQQPFAVLLTQADGVSVIHETVYEDRFGYLRAMNDLGARSQLTTHCLGGGACRYRNGNSEHSALIFGPSALRAVDCIRIPDLRAGLAYVVGAAVASGTTKIAGLPFLERGYGNIVPRLAAMDLRIEEAEI